MMGRVRKEGTFRFHTILVSLSNFYYNCTHLVKHCEHPLDGGRGLYLSIGFFLKCFILKYFRLIKKLQKKFRSTQLSLNVNITLQPQ